MCNSFSVSSIASLTSASLELLPCKFYTCNSLAWAFRNAFGDEYRKSEDELLEEYSGYHGIHHNKAGFAPHFAYGNEDWYSFSLKKQYDYRTEMLYYFWMSQNTMDGVA